MNRRHLLMTIPAIALAACSTTEAQVAQQVITDATTITNALLNVLPNVQGVPASTVTIVTADAQQAEALAATLSTTMTQVEGQAAVAQIQGYANDVIAAVKPYLAPGSQAANIVADIQLALPILLAAAQMVTTAAASPASAAAMGRLAALPKRG